MSDTTNQPRSIRVTRTCGNSKCKHLIDERIVLPEAQDRVARRMRENTHVECQKCRKTGKSTIALENSDRTPEVGKTMGGEFPRRKRVNRAKRVQPAPAARRQIRKPRRVIVPPVAARRANKVQAMQTAQTAVNEQRDPRAGVPRAPLPAPPVPGTQPPIQAPRRSRAAAALEPRKLASDQTPRREIKRMAHMPEQPAAPQPAPQPFLEQPMAPQPPQPAPEPPQPAPQPPQPAPEPAPQPPVEPPASGGDVNIPPSQ